MAAISISDESSGLAGQEGPRVSQAPDGGRLAEVTNVRLGRG
jgi:hypothetical protein